MCIPTYGTFPRVLEVSKLRSNFVFPRKFGLILGMLEKVSSRIKNARAIVIFEELSMILPVFYSTVIKEGKLNFVIKIGTIHAVTNYSKITNFGRNRSFL